MQEKQKQVLDIFKEMQKKDVFTMLASGTTLDTLIQNAETYDDIASSIQDIKEYIKRLDRKLKPKTSIDIVLGGFYDKFQYHLYNMYMAPFNQKEKMYILEEKYGERNPITLCLKANDPRFSLEERKLLKLIEHYYITMKDKDKSNMLYVPIADLRKIFSKGTNLKKMKETIITACERINDKRVSWNFSKTGYASTKYKKKHNLKDLKLDIGKNIKLVNIIPVYSQCDKDNNMELKGIICKASKFLELRFWLHQISYRFPTEALRGDYLSYCVTDYFCYHMHMKGNQGEVSRTIKNIALSLYDYENGLPTTSNYWDIIYEDDHKPRYLLYLLKALTNMAYCFSLNKQHKVVSKITSNSVNIKVLHYGNPREAKEIFNEISATRDKDFMKEIVAFCSLFKRNVTFDDLLHVHYPKQFSYIQLEQNKKQFTDSDGKVDMEKLRAILVANIKLKWKVVKLIDDDDPIDFKVMISEL